MIFFLQEDIPSEITISTHDIKGIYSYTCSNKCSNSIPEQGIPLRLILELILFIIVYRHELRLQGYHFKNTTVHKAELIYGIVSAKILRALVL